MTQQRRPDETRLRRRAPGGPGVDARNGVTCDATHADTSDPGGLRGLLTSRQRARAAVEAAEREEALDRGREMGERLRMAREGLALSLAEAERDTRINRVYLEALEGGRFEALPAPIYARGFMRSYARYLGLDPEEALEAVPRDLPRPAGLEPLAGLRRMRSDGFGISLSQLNVPVVLAAVLGVVVIVAAVMLVPQLGGGDGIDLPLRGGEQGAATQPPGGATPTPPAAEQPPAEATVPPFAPGTVPDFSGVHRDEAVSVLEEIGLTPLIFEAPHQTPAGRVFQQSPAPGEAIADGGTVTLFVSQGPGG